MICSRMGRRRSRLRERVAVAVSPLQSGSTSSRRSRCRAAARGADDQADLPWLIEARDLDAEARPRFGFDRQVEHAGDLAHAEAVEHGTLDYNVNTRHVRPSDLSC